MTSLRIERLKLLQSLTRVTTIDQQPFNSLLKPGFQSIIGEKLRKFEQAGILLNLDSKLSVVKNYIHNTAASIRNKIKNEMKDRFFSIMADGFTKNNRSFLGISAQYVLNGRLIIRSFGLKQLTESHTGEYLSNVIKHCVEEYDCRMNQAIGVTTDNASNMLKMVRELNKQICEAPESIDIETVSNDETVLDDEDIQYVSSSEDTNDAHIEELLQRMECEEIQALLNDSDDDEEEVQFEMFSNFPQSSSIRPIFLNRVNCGTHTLQLVVKDGLKSLRPEHTNIIKLCRQFVKFVRRQTSINELRQNGIIIKLLRLDCLTRWSSTYVMVSTDIT